MMRRTISSGSLLLMTEFLLTYCQYGVKDLVATLSDDGIDIKYTLPLNDTWNEIALSLYRHPASGLSTPVQVFKESLTAEDDAQRAITNHTIKPGGVYQYEAIVMYDNDNVTIKSNIVIAPPKPPRRSFAEQHTETTSAIVYWAKPWIDDSDWDGFSIKCHPYRTDLVVNPLPCVTGIGYRDTDKDDTLGSYTVPYLIRGQKYKFSVFTTSKGMLSKSSATTEDYLAIKPISPRVVVESTRNGVAVVRAAVKGLHTVLHVECIPDCEAIRAKRDRYQVTDLKFSVRYSVRFRAFSDDLADDWGPYTHFSIEPFPVRSLEASTKIGNDSVWLLWKNPSVWNSIDIECGTKMIASSGCARLSLNSSADPSSSTIISGLIPGQTYSFRFSVVANGMKETNKRNVSATIFPAPPSSLQATFLDDSRTTSLSWQAPSKGYFDGFLLKCIPACKGAGTIDSGRNNTMLTGLKTGQVYQVYLRSTASRKLSSQTTTEFIADKNACEVPDVQNGVLKTKTGDTIAAKKFIINGTGIRLVCDVDYKIDSSYSTFICRNGLFTQTSWCSAGVKNPDNTLSGALLIVAGALIVLTFIVATVLVVKCTVSFQTSPGNVHSDSH